MARSVSPDREKARLYWLSTGCKAKNTEIAAHLGVSTKSISRWRKEDRWNLSEKSHDDGQKENTAKDKKGQKRTKPKDPNRNLGGAPKGNINNLKHGRYSKRYWDFINEDEVEMLSEFDDDYFLNEERQLLDQIKLYTVRERRLMEMIEKVKKKLMNGKESDSMIVHNATTIEMPDDKDKALAEAEGKKAAPTVKSSTSHTKPKDYLILDLEEQLGRTQEKKTKAILALADVRAKQAKALVDSKAVSNGSEPKVVVYLPDNGR